MKRGTRAVYITWLGGADIKGSVCATLPERGTYEQRCMRARDWSATLGKGERLKGNIRA